MVNIIKSLIISLLVISCNVDLKNESLKILVKETFIEYEIMTYKDFISGNIKPESIMMTFFLLNNSDTSFFYSGQNNSLENNRMIWIINDDSVELMSLMKNRRMEILPNEKSEIPFNVPYCSFKKIKSIFNENDIFLIKQKLYKTDVIFDSQKSNIKTSKISFRNSNLVFNFMDTTIFVSPN